MSQYYQLLYPPQRHKTEIIAYEVLGDHGYRSFVRPEYDAARCGSCRYYYADVIAETKIPKEVHARVRIGTDFFSSLLGFPCVSTRLKEFFQSLDGTLRFQAFPNDDFHLVIPAAYAKWNPELTGIRDLHHCTKCGWTTGGGPIANEALHFDDPDHQNRIFRLEPSADGYGLYCNAEIKRQAETRAGNQRNDFRGINLSELLPLAEIDRA